MCEIYYKATRKLVIHKFNGNTYYLANWKIDSTGKSFLGDGVCLNNIKDTVQTGYLQVELEPNDYITAKRRDNKGTEILYIVIGVAAMIGITYLTFEPSVTFTLER